MKSRMLAALSALILAVPAGAQQAQADADLAQPAAPAEAPPPNDAPPAPSTPRATPNANGGYEQKDILSAADRTFGKGAEGLAKLIEKIFADLGKPNAYIAGREASGAFIVGLRYGSGTLFHSVEGDMPVYWSGPSIGPDIGGDGSKVFTLVYHLDDSGELFRNYPAVEGKVYVIGGFTANYLQRDKVILVPIKLGVGWRLGANIGSLCYSRESKWLPICRKGDSR